MLAENLVDSHVPFSPKKKHDQDQMTTFEANGEANDHLGLDAGMMNFNCFKIASACWC